MKSHIEKTLSHLYRQHGAYSTIVVNGLLLSFEKDSSGDFKLFVYDNADYNTYDLELDLRDEFPIVLRQMDKQTKDKILGVITRE